MTLRMLFLLLLPIACLMSCGDDDSPEIADLQYDADNFSAPFLPAGTHEAAARFTASQTAAFTGKFLERVTFYIQEKPAACAVRVYGEGDENEPGTLLYDQDVTITVDGNSWNSHTLSSPVEITGDDLWISIRVFHDTNTASVGCDPGPAVPNGDWTYNESDMEWRTLRDRTDPIVDINWNVRGFASVE